MQAPLVPRRTQFSSCDACRKSRVACDAAQARSSVRSTPGVNACSRCVNRNQQCTFEWLNRPIARAKKRTASSELVEPGPLSPASAGSSRTPESESRFGQSPTSNPSYSRVAPDSHADSWPGDISSPDAIDLGDEMADWLVSVYEDIFEEVFGSWIGSYGCPFTFGKHGSASGDNAGHDPYGLTVSISSLCSQFDRRMKDLELGAERQGVDNAASEAETSKERQIDRTLRQAMQTYSARWLLLTAPSVDMKTAYTSMVERLWRNLRKELLKVINRPCYRSMLTLFIFALTPIPTGITAEEEDDGIPAQFCVQAALQQVQHLRARQRSLEFNGSKVTPLPPPAAINSAPDRINTDFMGIESVIYFAALTFDTSASVTLNIKSVLSSGLLGWESESSWRLIRTCTDIVHEQTEEWRLQGMEVTESNANQLIAGASAWKLLVWKIGGVLKEALREGKEEEVVQCAFERLMKAVEQFNVTYRPLLASCERRMQFLSQYTKLRWYELMLHYNLCIFISIDAIEIAGRMDLLEQLKVVRSDIEGSVLNCLIFGLSNHFYLPRQRGGSESSGAVSLLSIDPYTHHVVAGVKLLGKAIQRDYDNQNVDAWVFESVQKILLRTLEELPQTSKSVLQAKEQALSSQIARANGPVLNR